MVLTLEEKVRDIVNKYDPIGLLKMGCPEDEYNPEIKRIIPLLKTVVNRKEFHDEVYHIFVDMYDKRTAGSKKDYKKLSEEIYELWNSSQIIKTGSGEA